MKIPTLEEYKQLSGYKRRQIRKYMRSQNMTPLHARTGIAGPLKGRIIPERRGPKPPRPHVWRSGPDQFRHIKFIAWGRHKSQAQYRGEDYQMSFEDFETAWADQFDRRGRSADSLIMVRVDDERAWHLDNVELIDRREHLRREGKKRRLARS